LTSGVKEKKKKRHNVVKGNYSKNHFLDDEISERGGVVLPERSYLACFV